MEQIKDKRRAILSYLNTSYVNTSEQVRVTNIDRTVAILSHEKY